jgi:hypothetical protein
MCRVAAGAAQPPVCRYFELPNFVEMSNFGFDFSCSASQSMFRVSFSKTEIGT